MSDLHDRIHNHTAKAAAARQVITERFLTAVEEAPDPAETLVAFPGFLTIRSMRTNADGTMNVTVTVPRAFVNEIYLPLTRLIHNPLAITVEQIDLPDVLPDA